MDTSLKATNLQILGYENQIEEEARRMATHTQAKREESQRKLEQAREAVTTEEIAVRSLGEQKRQAQAQCDASKAEGMATEQEQLTLKKRIQETESMIERCKQHEKNALIPYGKDIKGVLEQVKKMRWVGDAPLGPLGMYVKAKNPEIWGGLLRNQLGAHLTAFAVTDAKDRPQLKRLLEQSGK